MQSPPQFFNLQKFSIKVKYFVVMSKKLYLQLSFNVFLVKSLNGPAYDHIYSHTNRGTMGFKCLSNP